ncbi:hypothetical protein ACNKHT_01345 [Shigella flexneri]
MLARCAGEQRHGFNDADADHMFLYSVKVTILTPGWTNRAIERGGHLAVLAANS